VRSFISRSFIISNHSDGIGAADVCSDYCMHGVAGGHYLGNRKQGEGKA
jgi:hypothetical protein